MNVANEARQGVDERPAITEAIEAGKLGCDIIQGAEEGMPTPAPKENYEATTRKGHWCNKRRLQEGKKLLPGAKKWRRGWRSKEPSRRELVL